MPSALIVGAGIGGLAAAISLRRAGWSVRVVEQASSPRELGFALALAPNALAALGELGLRDAVVSRGVAIHAFEVRYPDGRSMKRVDLRGGAVQSIVLLRPALHGTLLDAVGRDALQLGVHVTGLASPAEDTGVRSISLHCKNQDLTPMSAEVVIGADGVASVIRKAVHPDEPPPRPSGYHALRGVSYDAGHRLRGADSAVYLGDGVEIGFARASESAIYWYVSLVDEFAGPDASVTLDRCTRGLDPDALAIMHATRADDIRLDRLFRRDPIASWGRGLVTLLGDAAHPVLPHTAQGAAQALEDAVALGLALRDARDQAAALRRYEAVRAARTRNVIRAGPFIASMTTTRSRARMRGRNAAIRLLPARVMSWTLAAHARDPHRRLRG